MTHWRRITLVAEPPDADGLDVVASPPCGSRSSPTSMAASRRWRRSWATARLGFREMTPDDLDDMAALLGDPQIMRYYLHPKTREEALAWIAWNQRLYRN